MVSEIREDICVNSLYNEPISRIQIRNWLFVYCLYLWPQYVHIRCCVCVCVCVCVRVCMYVYRASVSKIYTADQQVY